MSNHTFTDNGRSPDWSHKTRTSTMRFGDETSVNFGGGTLYIQAQTEIGTYHTIRTIQSLDELNNSAIIIEQPAGTRLSVRLEGATNPDLYVEHKEFRDSEDQR